MLVSAPLFAIADGMGGHAAGEVASDIAIRTLAAQAPHHADAQQLGEAVRAANLAVIEGVARGAGREGMGTTMTAAIVEGERLVIAQVGDSRAYLLSNGMLQQITRDHSLVAEMIEAGQLTLEEARVHPQRSVITRALGSSPHMQADLYELNANSGDRLMLCSDGLSGMVPDSAIAPILQNTRNPQMCADQLVELAKSYGGFDNITVIVVDIAGFAPMQKRKAAKRGKITAILIACLFAGAIAGAFIGFNAWIRNSAFLADSNGTVAIYQGVPGSLFGKETNELAYTSDVPTDKLNAGLAARLKDEGVSSDSIEAAKELLMQYATELNMKDAGIQPKQ